MARLALLTDARLVESVKQCRDACNSAFEAASRLYPALDGDDVSIAFAELLEAALPCLERSGFPNESTLALFSAALKSASSGTGTGVPLLSLKAANLAPLAFSSSPGRFLSECGKAIETVAYPPPGAVASWLAAVERCGAGLSTIREFEIAGLAAAWLSGLVRYREEAVRLLAEIAPESVAAILELDASARIDEVLRELAENPWLSPAEAAGTVPPPPCVAFLSGGHRALGGPFKEFPKLGSDRDGNPCAVSGGEAFRIHAVRQGVWFEPEETGDVAVLPDGAPGMDESRLGKILGEGSPEAAFLSCGVGSVFISDTEVMVISPKSFMVCVAGFPGGNDVLR